MKVGLVLEGGAMRGMYTAGVLDTFLDNDIKVDGIIGTSAGVLFGVNYPSKQKGRVIRYNKKYCKDKRYMGLHSLITSGNVINKEFSFYEVPFKLDIFDDKTFNESGIDFYATVTNIESGEPEYFKLTKILEQMEVLRATSAMPFVSEIVGIDGKKYLDGGVSDAIPLDKCIDLGYDKIIVVLTRVKDYRKKKSGDFFAKLMYKKYPKLIETMNKKYKVYNDTVEKIIDLENKKEIFVIRPSRYIDIKRIEKDENKLQEMYDLGIEDTKKCIEDLRKYLM